MYVSKKARNYNFYYCNSDKTALFSAFMLFYLPQAYRLYLIAC